MSYGVQEFETQVIERSRQIPVLVDFWAPWCGPCRTLGPVLEGMAAQAGGRWELAKINTEEYPELASAFKIASIPAVKLCVSGQVRNEFVGALSERQIRSFLDENLPSPSQPQIQKAEHLLSEGANDAAAELLESILHAEPANIEACVLLAQALLSSAPERIPVVLTPVGPDSASADRASALRTLGRLAHLANQPTALPEAKVRNRYLAGATSIRTGLSRRSN
jgi:putative thioredoxin